MKKLILTAFAATTMTASQAQVIADSVLTGASYANQVWYSLSGDEQGTAPKNNWDLAFDASGFGSTIHINSITGTTLWAYPKSDLSGWASVDTTGLSTWTPRYNSDQEWELGAMGRYADPANANDLDWGIYNMTTHVITGDSIYIIKLANGDYKKLAIMSLSSGTYSFQYANVDGTGLQTPTLAKSVYSGKNFGYYSLQSNAALDREPVSANWDLLFTQYTTFIPTAYTVTGALANQGVTIAKCVNVTGKDTFVTWGPQVFKSEINTIGYNWKTFSMTAGYVIQDSLVYFASDVNGDIWKLIFTGFGGSATGAYKFTKEKMTMPNNLANSQAPGNAIALYPNPSNGRIVNLVYNFPVLAASAKVSICDVAGRLLLTDNLDNAKGLHQYIIPTGNLQPGVYIVTVSTENAATQQRLIIQ